MTDTEIAGRTELPKPGNYLLGRQPILNSREELVAYELLFRSPGAETAEVDDASQATASVIVNALTGFGIHEIMGDHKGFINVDLDILMDDALNILPRENVVLELLETIPVTPEVVERCRFLKENGFTLALDDHRYDPAYEELYGIVDIVKIDLTLTPSDRLKETVGCLKGYPLQLLAEKVETSEEFNYCRDLGFHLFQGYYFARPSVIEKKRMDESGAALMKLMRLLAEDAEMAEIEKTFRESPGLTYKLLLLVNSIGIGLRSRIETLRHALTILGRQQIQRWGQLALIAAGDGRGIKGNPLLDLAAVRAGFMEHMAICQGRADRNGTAAEKAFMTGILSILEKVYDISMDEVVASLSLSDDVAAALMERQGSLGRLLQVAELVERMEFTQLGPHLEEMNVTITDVIESQRKSFTWRAGMA